MTHLDLSGNQLTSLPAEIGNLTILLVLDLSHNNLSSLPAIIGSLPNLTYLYLSHNQLSSLPVEIGSLTSLLDLNLSHNNLSSLPVEMSNLGGLQLLDIGHNPWLDWLTIFADFDGVAFWGLGGLGLTDLPGEITARTALRGLSLEDNLLTTLPAGISSLALLESLNLSGNQINSLPAEIGSLTSLQTLDLSNNALCGEAPTGLTDLAQLTDLDMGYNCLAPSHPSVQDFLSAHDPDWAETQTAPPTDLQAFPGATGGQIDLTWKPISYTQDSGYYEISYADSLNGPYTVHGVTPNKGVGAYSAQGLAEKNYFFRLRTYTPAHGEQKNALWSGYTAPLPSQVTFINPGQAQTLAYLDANGLSTTIEIPAGAVTETIGLVFAWVTPGTPPQGYRAAGHAFNLSAYRDGQALSPFSFQQPVTITIRYTNADMTGLDEVGLVLRYWDNQNWSEAACRDVVRDPEHNQIAVPICHLSLFALFGPQSARPGTVYLPLVRK